MSLLNKYIRGFKAVSGSVFTAIKENDHARACHFLRNSEGWSALTNVMVIREHRIIEEMTNPALPDKVVDMYRGMLREHKELILQINLAADHHQKTKRED